MLNRLPGVWLVNARSNMLAYLADGVLAFVQC
jgi:hypothetical protein